MTDARDRETKRNFGTLLALMGLVLCAVCFMLLVAIVMPAAANFLAVVFAMALFIAIHYFTWGRWMLRMRPDDLDDDENHESANHREDEPRRHGEIIATKNTRRYKKTG